MEKFTFGLRVYVSSFYFYCTWQVRNRFWILFEGFYMEAITTEGLIRLTDSAANGKIKWRTAS